MEDIGFGEADWYYFVGVDEGSGFQWQSSGSPNPNEDDWTVDTNHLFQVQSINVTIAMMLCEDDVFPLLDELADLSNDTAGGMDDIADCSTPASGTLNGTFLANWNLIEGRLYGGGYGNVSGYFQATGDSDGSIAADENDANLQFLVADNYNGPGADAQPYWQEAYIDEPVNFDAGNSTASPGSSIISYEWDFGDGTTESGPSPFVTHRYYSKDTFSVTLWVNDSIGQSSKDTITVDIVNQAPVASFTVDPPEPTTAQAVSFIDTSNDPDGGIFGHLWDFGDGQLSTQANPVHRYEDDGNYTVTLTVTDDEGAQNTTRRWVNVSNVGPVVSFGVSPVNPEVGDTVTFTDASTDPDGDVVGWVWDFNDGDLSSTQNATHVYGKVGIYNVTLTVTDDDGETGSGWLTIEVGPKTRGMETDWTLAILMVVTLLVLTAALILWWRYAKGGGESE